MSEVIKLINQKIIHSSTFRSFGVSYLALSIGTMWLFTISALIGMGLGFTDWFIPKTPLNLLIGLTLLFINIPLISGKSKFLFFFAFLVGMVVEIVGVASGEIFGIYDYGSNLGMKIMGVPLMIGIYWAVLVIVTSQIARSAFKNIITVSIAGSLLMVGLDFLMEQMASQFDFWHFENGIAGIKNYIAWFLVAFVLQVLSYRLVPKHDITFSLHLYLNQIAFFLVAYLLLG